MHRILTVLSIAALLLPIRAIAQYDDSDPLLTRCGFWERSRDKTWNYLRAGFDSLQFRPGERIADIGAKGATMAGMLSIFYDNIDMTLEDIDSSCLNARQVAYAVEHYRKVNGGTTAAHNRFQVVIGTETGTTLPDTAFRKVFFINTFHEVTRQPEMLRDLHRILAAGGTLYVEERVSHNKTVRHKDCHHIMPKETELLAAFEAAGFRLVKTNVTARYRARRDRIHVAWFQFAKV